ncbi:MAG TPA: helix-turn-helix transcriptional regulator [Streptosporangiaceae bacterium]
MSSLRLTLTTQMVLRALLDEPTKKQYGLELCSRAGLQSGTLYPILARLEQAGWVESNWEDPDVHLAEGRPRRRYYQLSRDGIEQARQALAQVSSRQTKAIWATPRLRPESGRA